MTNRYRSSCCCDQESVGSCFTGFGTVPKTRFVPYSDTCMGAGLANADGFNRWDNWSFCKHDKDEELLVYSERTKYKTTNPYFFGEPSVDCACSCCNRDGQDTTTVTPGARPIYAWYRHMKSDGKQNVSVPTAFIEDNDTGEAYLYFWRSFYREDLKPPYSLYPCCAPDHKFEESSFGYQHDSLCVEEDYWWLCGWDSEDNQWFWWRDDNGGLSYVTQAQMKIIGEDLPPGSGPGPGGPGWSTTKWGVVQANKFLCPSCDDPEFCNVNRSGGFCTFGSRYFYLQDIVKNGWMSGDGKLYRNFNISTTQAPSDGDAGSISVVPEYSWGSCEEYPYGLTPLVFTFWGVMHREKWWEQYWNSVSRANVCERDPDNPSEYVNCPSPYGQGDFPPGSGIPEWQVAQGMGLFPDKFANSCRFPQYIAQACAGVPIFTHELVEKLDEDEDVRIWWDGLEGDRKKVKVIDQGTLLTYRATSPAALVMGAMYAGSMIHPDITQKLEEVGILPPPQDYGESQNYKIFKKTFKYASTADNPDPIGACCVDTSLAGTERPIYADCDTVEEGTPCDPESPSCKDEPNNPFCCDETPGRTGCANGEPEYAGGNCDDYICQINIDTSYNTWWEDFANSEIGQLYQDNFTLILDVEDAFAALGELRFCCGLDEYGDINEDGFWNEDCVFFAKVLGGSACGPENLCAETTEQICRIVGGQWTEDAFCIFDPDNPDKTIVNCKDKADEIGSCCFGTSALGQQGESNLHCMEISRGDCSALINALSVGSSDDFAATLNDIPVTAIGASEEQKEELLNAFGAPVNGISNIRYLPLHNCEPLPNEDSTGELPLDNYSFGCNAEGDIPDTHIPDPSTYVCPNIKFEEEERYFYGRPGGWSHICSGFGQDYNIDGQDYFNAYFPNIQRYGASICNDTMPCWTAAPYPQFIDLPPSPVCTKCCEGPLCENCTYGITVCGEPLYSGCAITEFGAYYPGGSADTPGTEDWDENPYPNTNTSNVFQPCLRDGVSSTCFGAWFQSHHDDFERSPGTNCPNPHQFFCANVNNAFFLRIPNGRQLVGQDYEISLALFDDVFTDPGGGTDDPEFQPPCLASYINRILGDRINLYDGYEHIIYMTDGSLDINNLFTSQTDPNISGASFGVNDTNGSLVRLVILEETDQEIGSVEMNGKRFRYFAGSGSDFIITDNDGTPASDLYMTIDLSSSVGEPWNFSNLYWGLVFHKPFDEQGLLAPVPAFPDTSDLTHNPLFGYYRVDVGLQGQNPGIVADGLRDFEWYHAPTVQHPPIPSTFLTSSIQCHGKACCNTIFTQSIGPFECFWEPSDGVQGQSKGGGDTECFYTLLQSQGSGLPDPRCGPCPEGTYCCPGVNDAQCIPDNELCCDCPEGQRCVQDQNSGGLVICVPD